MKLHGPDVGSLVLELCTTFGLNVRYSPLDRHSFIPDVCLITSHELMPVFEFCSCCRLWRTLNLWSWSRKHEFTSPMERSVTLRQKCTVRCWPDSYWCIRCAALCYTCRRKPADLLVNKEVSEWRRMCRVGQNKISQHENCYISVMSEYFCTKFRSLVWHNTVH